MRNTPEIHSLLSMRNAAAGILAAAVCELFPSSQLIEGSSNEWGFFYDFLIPQPIGPDFIAPIEEVMRRIVKQCEPILKLEMMRENATQLFEHYRQPIKAAHVSCAPNNILSILRIGDFYDYLPGDVVPSTEAVGAIKICEISPIEIYHNSLGKVSAIRILGTVQANPQLLKKFLKKREAAKKRDHILLGQECGLYGKHAGISLSDWIWYPRGLLIKERLIDLWRQWQHAEGYKILNTPIVCQRDSLKESGYFIQKEKSELLFPDFFVEDVDYLLSPMESKIFFHAWFYKLQAYTSQDLPVRFAECSAVFCKFPTSRLEGLFRTPYFTADIAHSFCRLGQLEDELISSLHLIQKIINMMPVKWRCCLLLPLQKRILRSSSMAQVLSAINAALDISHLDYENEAALANLLGPRIEFRFSDALGREWAGPVLEINLDLPNRMQLDYINANGIRERPIMMSRSLFGSLDAFIGLMVEQCSGLLPLWIAPEQVRIIPVASAQRASCESAASMLRKAGIRVSIAAETISLKAEIHAAERLRVPYILIIGDREEKNGLVTIRQCGQAGINSCMTMEAFLSRIQGEDLMPCALKI